MADKAIRGWVAKCQWSDKKPFLIGTVFLENTAPLHDVEKELWAKFDTMFRGILPNETPNPKIIDMIPGAVFFVPEDEKA